MGSQSSGKLAFLICALMVGLAGCASGGGGGGGGMSVNDLLAQAQGGDAGERPRDTENTRAAEDALDDADDADTPAEAATFYQRALTSAQAAVAEDSTNPLAYRLEGLANMGLEDYQAAGAALDRAEELRPAYEIQDARMREQKFIDLYQEANPLLGQGDYEGAVEKLEGANAIFKGRPEAMTILAQLYAQLRNYDMVLARIDEVNAFFDSDIMAQADSATAAGWRADASNLPLMRAQVLADQGRMDEALAAYRELAAQDPQDLALKEDLASILQEMDRNDEALEVYQEIADSPGAGPNEIYRVGLGFYQAQRYGQAVDALNQVVSARPMDRDAIEWLVRSMQLDSAFADIPPMAQRWIGLDPASQTAYGILAQAENQNGNTQGAQAAVRQMQTLDYSVNGLQMRPGMDGGADVSGSLLNVSLTPGTNVSLVFTFYSPSGEPLGTVNQSVQAGAPNMNAVLQVHFDSAEEVGGYGYAVGG